MVILQYSQDLSYSQDLLTDITGFYDQINGSVWKTNTKAWKYHKM